MFEKYDGKMVRIRDRWGKMFTGIADVEGADYVYHEYGVDDEGIFVNGCLIYAGCVEMIEEAAEIAVIRATETWQRAGAYYVRIQALRKYGGIYFDTDVEVVRPFDKYLEGRSMVLGFESDRSLTTAFIACSKNHPFIEEFEKTYHERRFIKEDGSMDLTAINVGFSNQAEAWGLDLSRNAFQEIGDGIAVYPIEYFAAFDVKNWHERTGPNTCTIHHMDASWVEKKTSLHIVVIKSLQKTLGYDRYDRLRGFVGKLKGGK